MSDNIEVLYEQGEDMVALYNELQTVIEERASKFDMSYAVIAGVLEMLKVELLLEAFDE